MAKWPRIGWTSVMMGVWALFPEPLRAADPGKSAASGLQCVLLAVEGKVEVAYRGKTDWVKAETNQVLRLGDQIRTGIRSRATLRWSDLSVLRVDQLTTMEIARPEAPGGKSQLNLRSGAAYLFSREQPREIEFRTPVASGAIRGTEFNLKVGEGGVTTLTLLSGEAELGNRQGRTLLRSGEEGRVESGQAPVKTAAVEAINVIQWVLYYPAVLDLTDLNLTEPDQTRESLEAYRQGDLLRALASYPDGRVPGSDAERSFLAALVLAAGRVDEADRFLADVPAESPARAALGEMIAAVKHTRLEALSEPQSSSGWMGRSYYLQSQGDLAGARTAARRAVELSPEFGAAWVRLAEMELSFGLTGRARDALARGLELSPRNAQALALKGFLLANGNHMEEALENFNRAIEIDGGLGNAWLGRGLMKRRLAGRHFLASRERMELAGREDLQVAATLEPQRSLLRSYLAKAFADDHELSRAGKELTLAERLDPKDPTPWLYSALVNQQDNRINKAVEDLERSQDLNDNRSLFRSRLLLDQDQSVRGANLASIYRDEGMFDHSVQEASRAVTYDYANSSAHLFLANSYDSLRDPNLINLRYETTWYSELLMANLLAPVNSASLSRNVSQQEYSKLFAEDGLGLFSSTEYFSNGDWVQNASQYGYFGNTGYALDANYRNENGYRPNNELESLDLSFRLKQQVTEHDSLFFQVGYLDLSSGDVSQYYYQTNASPTFHALEKQEPTLLAGYHRNWSPGQDTLFLFGRLDDTLWLKDQQRNPLARTTYIFGFDDTFFTNDFVWLPNDVSWRYRREIEAYSAELQHAWQTPFQTLVVGARYQQASLEATNYFAQPPSDNPFATPIELSQRVDADMTRVTAYLYEQIKLCDNFRLIGGISYDRLEYPENIDTPPITGEEKSLDQFSPKAGLLWSPWRHGNVRFAYTRSLGGAYFDQSVRLEPVQVAGFNQAFRSLIPESVMGLVPGTRFETFGVGLDHRFDQTRTYVLVNAELLRSDATRTVGMLTNDVMSAAPLTPNQTSGTRQALDFEELSLVAAVNQLIGREFSVGVRYRVSEAQMDSEFLDIPLTTGSVSNLNRDVSALLHQVSIFGNWFHRSGFFAQFEAVWSHQSNDGYAPDLPTEDLWQYNFFVGYRFLQRRMELRVGVLNLTDNDYNLNPLTLYNEMPRDRTFFAGLRFNF